MVITSNTYPVQDRGIILQSIRFYYYYIIVRNAYPNVRYATDG